MHNSLELLVIFIIIIGVNIFLVLGWRDGRNKEHRKKIIWPRTCGGLHHMFLYVILLVKGICN